MRYFYTVLCSLLSLGVLHARAQAPLDSLIAAIPSRAEGVEKSKGTKAAIREMYRYIDELQSKGMTALQKMEAYHHAAMYCESASEMREAYRAMTMALTFAGKLDKQRAYYMAKCEYNLGSFAYKMANVSLSEKHQRTSLAIKSADPSIPPEDLYFSYNAMGAIEWHHSRYDSARQFFNHALAALEKMPDDNINRRYRPALIKNNLVAIYREEGNTSEALKTAYEVVDSYQAFLQNKGGDDKKKYAVEDWCAAIDNLAGIYEDIGDYKQQESLLLYAYRQKQQKLREGSPAIAISEVLLGQYYNKVRSYDKARGFLLRAVAHLNEANGDFTFWKADAAYAMALLDENTGRTGDAEKEYGQSLQLYESAYAGAYDNVYMDFLRNKALFVAAHGRYAEAVATAGKIGDYLRSNGEEKSTQGSLLLASLGKIHYLSGRYRESIQYCDRALAQLHKPGRTGTSALDSIRAEVHMPGIILIKAQSVYALQEKKDPVFLVMIYQQLDSALKLLERRKMLIDDPASIDLLIAEHQGLIDFFTRISLELYNQGGSSHYLEEFINVREGALYGRIRSRLNKEKAIRYSNVPATVIAEENRLKEKIRKSLQHTGADNGQFTQYQQAVKAWEQHLAMVKKEYPRYYRLRYATLFYTLPQLQGLVPDSTTLVRYYMTDSSLVALVADSHSRHIIPLRADGLRQIIDSLRSIADERTQLNALHQLYRRIWAPLSNYITTKKVMVIPDGVLYNVSMDMLPYEPATSFRSLAEKSLLARHSFSYHYSLFMLEEKPAGKQWPENYIAFAPGFSDDLKAAYLQRMKDSLRLDKNYLTLLPQPANQRLAERIKDIVGGKIFLDSSSTSDAFRRNAGEHRIIHIATHAEYNNAMPEQSGLFFAKDSTGANDNFITLGEIYSCPMDADLMILTACESGRPGYQDGEGLISLAHAFNYAGSRNILTALWKIDEVSSASIAEHFIHHLKEGLYTDEALQQAKLDYLRESDGRILAPAYWSGLVLMGRPQKVQVNDPTGHWNWSILGIALAVGLAIFLLVRNRRIA